MTPKFFFSFVFFLGIFFIFFIFTFFAEFLSVKNKNLILFEGPSTATKKKFIVTEGYPLKVIVSLKDWKKVEDHLGKISWAQTKNLVRERTVITLNPQATIYNKPSTSEAKLAYIEELVVLSLVSPIVTNGWIKVKSVSTGLEGFIRINEVWGI